jgi:hypothetical protein
LVLAGVLAAEALATRVAVAATQDVGGGDDVGVVPKELIVVDEAALGVGVLLARTVEQS